MDRDIPVFNRPIMDKIFKKNQQKHLERLRNIKSGSSNRTMPIQQNHALSNKKALLVEQQKRTQIEKQNVLLFNKMMRIMKRNDPNNQPNFAQQLRLTKTGSENSRIVEENRFILQRIEHQKPTISNKKLQEQRIKNLTILRFLGKYPNPSASRTGCDTSTSQVGRKSESKRKYDSYNRGDLQQFSFENQMSDQQFKKYQEQVKRVKQTDIQNSNRRRKHMSQTAQKKYFTKKIDSEGSEGVSKLANIDVNNNIGIQQQKIYFRQSSKPIQRLDDMEEKTHFSNPPFSKQIVLFQKKGEINKKPAEITFIRYSSFYKIKAVFQEHYNGLTSYDLEIPEEEGNEFFQQCNYDYNRICRMLVIQDGCLVVNPSLQKFQEENQVDYSGQKERTHQSEKKIIVNSRSEKEIGQDQQNWARYEEALEQSIE